MPRTSEETLGQEPTEASRCPLLPCRASLSSRSLVLNFTRVETQLVQKVLEAEACSRQTLWHRKEVASSSLRARVTVDALGGQAEGGVEGGCSP